MATPSPYVIFRHGDELDPSRVVFEDNTGRGSKGDLVRINYTEENTTQTIYLQSAKCLLRSALFLDNELQKAVDIDLWEAYGPKNAEFVKKIRTVERRVSEHLKNLSQSTTGKSADMLLKSSVRVLYKVKKQHIPTFRMSTDSLDVDNDISPQGEELELDCNAKVQIIVELVGLRINKQNGSGKLVWRLAKLKKWPEEQKTVGSGVDPGRLPAGIDQFQEDEQ
jgi:hypothetical protein